MVSYQEIQIVDDWFEASGLNVEQVENYKNQYTDNQLLTMGRNGDIVAYQALISRRIHNAWTVGDFDYSRLSAEKLVEDREAFDRAYQEMLEAAAVSEAYRKETQGYMDEAIAAGSVYEISARARSALKEPSPEDSLEQRTETLQSLREAFAYFELYSLRGADGVYTVDSAKQRELQQFRDAYDLDEPLTAQDYAWIQNRAQTLYREYQRMRRNMGFGEFDNTMPPEVNEFLNGPFDR
ncbi:hypothetical protein [Gilvimarinus xylanilyticus]|uniref:Uncharacterized protein n=1 Tax=Gilvimarinus xylanilyticus TaxID=2944139 RepID=A0A9X2HWK2_9GAMM|nr:hypothetical protein [Gilvimarinus xylanilyticus]MCP8899455.1 hypothetical protein [Gilvimarinus xylanilyticus]